MTHDKLCELAAGCVCAKWLPEGTECDNCMCDCELIAKAREDDYQAAVEIIKELQEDSPYVRADDVIEALSDILRPDGATQ